MPAALAATHDAKEHKQMTSFPLSSERDDMTKPCYDPRLLMDNLPIIDELVDAMNEMGWGVYSFDHEDANGQFETDFKDADALSMVGRFVFFRMMANEIACKHGAFATFMPKPSADRTNMLRIPFQGARVECRAADIGCNPYLGAAMILAAGLEGIRDKLDPGQPHRENMYHYSEQEVAQMGIETLPRTLSEAINAFEADPLSLLVFGDAMYQAFVDFKHDEWNADHAHVSD
nr:hypothetical protein [Tepidiphilus succinatimandens]